MRLTVSLASRGRPELLRATLERTVQNIAERDTRIVVCLDEDDERSRGFHFEHDNVLISIAPREDGFGEKWNRAVSIAPADAYALQADYAPIITPGFDTKVLEAAAIFPDGIGAVYNHLANMSFPSLVGATAGLVKKMGYLMPPGFPYWFVDHWLDDVARMIGRIACADVHADCTRRPGTQDKREPAFWAVYYDALVFERREIALRIINDPEFQEPAWRRRMLVSAAHLIEERSYMINTFVRAMPATDVSVDERYLRIKARAMQKLREIAPQIEAMTS